MIHQLSQELINKIAAGEVVERPNSVVKELVENSIDAKSTQITVEINEDLIKISDNGIGIEKDDLSKLFINHSTSKIESIDDLSSIYTMGFRGEALATIASVSKIEIRSHHKDSDNGYLIIPNGKTTPIASNIGTTIEVKELFYNVPARKKFLKSPSLENKYIIDTITKISIAHPEIGFKLIIKEKLIYNLIPGSLEQRIKNLIPNINLIPLIADDLLNGYIAAPKDTFSRPTYQYLYVNNRYINASPTISRAVFTGYKNSIMRGQYPPYVLFINIKPEEVDVNVHPRKLEVRFENDGYIFQKIYSVIQHTLFREDNQIFNIKDDINKDHPHNENSSIPISFAMPNTEESNLNFDAKKPSSYIERAMNFSSEILKPLSNPFEKVDIGTAHQYMNSYIMTQTDDSIVVFDQHACSERFIFEKYKQFYSDKAIKTKGLLIHELVPEEHDEFINEKKEILESFGIKILKNNNNTYITDIPEFATLKIIDNLYAEIKTIFDEDLSSVSDLQDKMITTLACHSAIRFGDTLNEKECQRIITDLFACVNKLTCPHGRPTYYEIPKDRLKEIFKR